LRDALFARVGQYAVRILAFRTFVHLHELSLRFHLERRTGGLSRIIERGVKGIETIVRFTMLATAPTILEFALTAGIWGASRTTRTRPAPIRSPTAWPVTSGGPGRPVTR